MLCAVDDERLHRSSGGLQLQSKYFRQIAKHRRELDLRAWRAAQSYLGVQIERKADIDQFHNSSFVDDLSGGLQYVGIARKPTVWQRSPRAATPHGPRFPLLLGECNREVPSES